MPTFIGWYLCGPRACLNFELLAVQDSTLFNGTARWNVTNIFKDTLQLIHSQYKTFYAAVCMSGPFFFLLTNNTSNDSALNCSQVSCHLSSCQVNETTVTVVRVPDLLPIPVNQLVPSCSCRSKIIVAASAVAVEIAISQVAAVASTADSLAGQFATAFERSPNPLMSIFVMAFSNLTRPPFYKSS